MAIFGYVYSCGNYKRIFSYKCRNYTRISYKRIPINQIKKIFSFAFGAVAFGAVAFDAVAFGAAVFFAVAFGAAVFCAAAFGAVVFEWNFRCCGFNFRIVFIVRV